jgi:hypothetical protein
MQANWTEARAASMIAAAAYPSPNIQGGVECLFMSRIWRKVGQHPEVIDEENNGLRPIMFDNNMFSSQDQ